MKKQTNLLLILLVLSILGFTSFNGNATAPIIVGDPEISVPLTSFTPYSTSYKVTDALISDKVIDLTFWTGFLLLEDDTELVLDGTVFESDDITLSGVISFYDREEYSPTFLNSTWDSGTATNTTINDEFVVGSRGTSGFANASTSAAITGSPTATWISQMAFNSNDDSDFDDATDKAYMPVTTSEWMYIGFKVNHLGSVNAASYGSADVIFERTSGTDWTVSLRAFQGSGDSGWVLSGANTAVFNFYDADNQFLGISFPIDELYTEDSAENGDLLGIDSPAVTINLAAASETVEVTVTNYALFNSRPALTDNTDEDDDFDWNDDTTGIPVGVHDGDSDFLFTKITEAATDTYDSKIALNDDYDLSMSVLPNIRIAKFDGAVSLYPTSASVSSSQVSGQVYFNTRYDLQWDSLGLSDLDTFSNILSIGNMQFNYTLDDSNVPFTTSKWEDNLILFTWDNQPDAIFTYADTWQSSGGDEVEVQYDFTDFSTTTGDIISLEMEVLTLISHQVTTVAATVVAPVLPVGAPADQTELLMWVVGIALVVVSAWYLFIRKPPKSRRR